MIVSFPISDENFDDSKSSMRKRLLGIVRRHVGEMRRRVNIKDRGHRSIALKYGIPRTDDFIPKNDLGVT